MAGHCLHQQPGLQQQPLDCLKHERNLELLRLSRQGISHDWIYWRALTYPRHYPVLPVGQVVVNKLRVFISCLLITEAPTMVRVRAMVRAMVRVMNGKPLSFTDLLDFLASVEKRWITLQCTEHVWNFLWIRSQVRLSSNQVGVCLLKRSEYLTYFELVDQINSLMEWFPDMRQDARRRPRTAVRVAGTVWVNVVAHSIKCVPGLFCIEVLYIPLQVRLKLRVGLGLYMLVTVGLAPASKSQRGSDSSHCCATSYTPHVSIQHLQATDLWQLQWYLSSPPSSGPG